MPTLSRKLSMLAVLLLSTLLQPTAFAQRCSGAPGCARPSSTPADLSGVAALNGQFAFLLNGTLTTPGITSRATAAVGSFTADGQGNITAGELDFASAAQTLQALPITGTYTLDNVSGVGTLNLTSTKGTESFVFYATNDGSGMSANYSGSLVETDGGPVVSSGTFCQQDHRLFNQYSVDGFWQAALTGETFVTEGTSSPIFLGGSLYLRFGDHSFLTATRRVGSGAPESIVEALLSGEEIDNSGRINFTAYDYPLHIAAYIVDLQHILVVSADPPQVYPLMSGTL